MRDLLLDIIAIVVIFMMASAIFGSGAFYNKCMKRIESFVHCDTIEVNK